MQYIYLTLVYTFCGKQHYKLPYSRTSVNVLQKDMNDKCTYDKSVIHKHVNNSSKTNVNSFIHSQHSINKPVTNIPVCLFWKYFKIVN